MTYLPSRPQEQLSIWQGRRGLVNTVACLVLSLPCAYGLWLLVERSTIVPACTAYASAHGMSYTDFKLTGHKHASTVVCLLTRQDGTKQDIQLKGIVSFFTDTWVGFAMTLEITVPAFAILLAMLLVAISRPARGGARRPDGGS